MTDLTSLTLAQARNALRSRECSATELTDAYIAAIEKARVLNAFVLEVPDRARAMAQEADVRLAKGDGGLLEGLPLGVKDLFCTKDLRTTACSRILENFVQPTNPLFQPISGATAQCSSANSIDEFAMGSSNETSYFGPVVSPWRRRGSEQKIVPGGSSGGSAAAVSAGLCAGAAGTDTAVRSVSRPRFAASSA